MSATPYTADDVMESIHQELTAAREAHASKGIYIPNNEDPYERKWSHRYGRSYRKWLGLAHDRRFQITEFNSYEILLLVQAKKDFIKIMKELALYRKTDRDLENMAKALQLLKTDQSGSQ